MKKLHSLLRTTFLLVGLTVLLASCETLKFSMMKDDQLITSGIDAWNTDRASAARAYWTAVRDPALKSQWLGRLDQYDALEKTFDAAAATAPTPEQPLLAAWDSSIAALAAFPSELKLPATFKPRLIPVAKAIVAGRLEAEKNSEAKAFMKTASDYLGDLIEWSAELQAIQDYEKAIATAAAYRALDKSLEKTSADSLAAARAKPDFDDQIPAYEVAIAAYTKAETTLAAQAKTNGYKEGSALALLSDKYRKKRGEIRAEMEKKLRDRSYSFKERIGEEFARTPEGNQIETMSLDDVLKFNEGIKVNIEAMQAEVIAFAAKYPKVIDKDMLKDVDDQKRALEDRIAQIAVEIKRAQEEAIAQAKIADANAKIADAKAKAAAELASRGRPVLPLMIGLFNPQPGGMDPKDQKSRPGKFQGSTEADTAYWWGMVDISKGVLNDLVITVDDTRPVRVFSDNTNSGKKIEEKKLKDLVNRQYKVGNSWPVINAGAQLAEGRYFFELGKGKDNKYRGDVVVYSSFIVRMR